ncbi:MAG: HutD family protein [Pirellulaceae bacterium]
MTQMIRIIPSSEFVTTPWKNGGGVTHEIARAEDCGQWLWRLSIAEVESDGPFSRFDGLSRILTVIEGTGINLEMPDGVLAVRPLNPIAFHGELPVIGRLIDGPIRDLNVIFDASRIEASVTTLTGPLRLPATGEPPSCSLQVKRWSTAKHSYPNRWR